MRRKRRPEVHRRLRAPRRHHHARRRARPHITVGHLSLRRRHDPGPGGRVLAADCRDARDRLRRAHSRRHDGTATGIDVRVELSSHERADRGPHREGGRCPAGGRTLTLSAPITIQTEAECPVKDRVTTTSTPGNLRNDAVVDLQLDDPHDRGRPPTRGGGGKPPAATRSPSRAPTRSTLRSSVVRRRSVVGRSTGWPGDRTTKTRKRNNPSISRADRHGNVTTRTLSTPSATWQIQETPVTIRCHR